MQNIKLDLTFLRDFQKEFFKKAKQFNVLVVHRRAGKTILVIIYLIYKALQDKGMYGYIGPYYKQTKLIAFDFLCKFAGKIPGTQINRSELKVTLFNGATIILFGADNPDSLRGLDLRGVVFDEYAQQPTSIYGEIIFPMINANNGWVTWIGTPKGKNLFYRLYKRAIEDEKFYVAYLTVDDTKLLNQQQLDLARAEISEEEYNQEYFLSWNAAIQGSYYGKHIEQARKEGRIKKAIFDSLLPVYTFWDLGMSDAMAIVFIQVVGNEIRVIDYYEYQGQGFEHYRDTLLGKHPNHPRMAKYNYEMHYFPHDIAVRELSTGLSRFETVQDMFGQHKCDIIEKHSIMDGINAGRRIFEKIYFDEDTTELFLDKLASYASKIDEKTGVVGKPEHNEFSHCGDAFRYMAMGYTKAIAPVGGESIMTINYDDFLY